MSIGGWQPSTSLKGKVRVAWQILWERGEDQNENVGERRKQKRRRRVDGACRISGFLLKLDVNLMPTFSP